MDGLLIDQKKICEGLNSSKSIDRRKAAKLIGELKLVDMSRQLLNAYEKEQNDYRTWETKVAMINSLGLIAYSHACPIVKSICYQNKENDSITIAAATSYVRISRQNINDASCVIELLRFGKYSVRIGCLNALGYDRMIPSVSEINQIINLITTSPIVPERGFSDSRYGLAAASAGWPPLIVKDFLNDCMHSDDIPLKYVAEKSLKGKYVKLR